MHFVYSQTNYFNSILAHKKLDKLLCPLRENTTVDTPIPRKDIPIFERQGCDTVDQNCDVIIDDCQEDQVAPRIDLDNPIPKTPFGSIDDARAFLDKNPIFTDDCVVQEDLNTTIADPTCVTNTTNGREQCTFLVTASDPRCVNEPPPAAPTRNSVFVLKVDSTPADITCSFFIQQDKKHVIGGFDPCLHEPVPYPEDGDILHIDYN